MKGCAVLDTGYGMLDAGYGKYAYPVHSGIVAKIT